KDEMMRTAASTRSIIALSSGPMASGALIVVTKSLSARQTSGEKRSRIMEATARAVLTSRGSDPSNSLRVSAARAINAADVCQASGGAAIQALSRALILEMTGAVASPASATRLI